ncbi:biosynthetic peptidoglycan transglycosylase [Clostridium oceanicum]|uniref:Penicillin-binding protein 1A n=1 Tax=Clostridium oceanicum TaxID=1543 RepID=A0ABP3UQG6_9CLOT
MKKILFLLLLIISIYVAGIYYIENFDSNNNYKLDHTLISQISRKHPNYVDSDNIPQSVKDAVVSMEDKRFYMHFGFDPISIGRSIYVDIKNKKIVQGGSTISQQLARNLFLNNKKSFKRKIEEIFLAIKLELNYSKKEILEMYLNIVYFGNEAYGVNSASKIYFGKNVSNISRKESAMLAGIIQSPNNYNPKKNYTKAMEREKIVLNVMNKTDIIGKKHSFKQYIREGYISCKNFLYDKFNYLVDQIN